jgi:hypothetical protein
MKEVYKPRKLARKVAKANMRKAGLRKVNRQMRFGAGWRKYVQAK